MTTREPAAGTGKPPVQRPVVSRLLAGGPGVDDTTRQRLLVTIDGRHAVLVELNMPPGAIADSVRAQFGDVFRPVPPGRTAR